MAFVAAYAHWREIRRKNNEAVLKSREQAKRRKQEQEAECARNEAENTALQSEIQTLRADVAFLAQVGRLCCRGASVH